MSFVNYCKEGRWNFDFIVNWEFCICKGNLGASKARGLIVMNLTI
jgi:hypothetical protein